MTALQAEELTIFYSYAHEDQLFREQLEQHLSNLKRLYSLKTWSDCEILPGENWEEVIAKNLNTADIIFLLISADFMASDYCYNTEMRSTLKRHEQGEVRVIPILVRPVHWKNAPFSFLQILPKDARPVTSWSNIDEALLDVVEGIEKVIQDLLHLRSVREVQRSRETGESADEASLATNQQECVAYTYKVIDDDVLKYINQGDALHSLQRYEEATHAYLQAICLHPNFAMKSNYNSDPPIDLQTAEQEIRLDPKNAVAYRNKCYALLELQRYEEALQAGEQAIHLHPDAIDYNNKAYALNSLKRYEEALQACEQARALNPRLSVVYKNQGYILYNLKRYEEALQACERAIQRNPHLVPGYAIKGVILSEFERSQESSSAFAEWSERYFR